MFATFAKFFLACMVFVGVVAFCRSFLPSIYNHGISWGSSSFWALNPWFPFKWASIVGGTLGSITFAKLAIK